MNSLIVQLRSRLRASGARLRGEAGFGLVEAVIAMTLFLVVGTAMADVLSSSATSHGFTMDQTLGQQAADAQIEDVRALPYDSVGTTGGNPPGNVAPTESATAVGITGLAATVTTSIHFVGDGIPDGYNSTTNYKQVIVTVTRTSDGRNLATESTYIAPPARAPYGGINEVALGVIVTDIGDNQPVPGVPIALQKGPSSPRSDTTDTNGGVLFAGMTANQSSDPPTAYYSVAPTIPPGYDEMPGDVTQTQLLPGQIKNLSIRVYQPATINLALTSGAGVAYTGSATVTLTPVSGAPVTYNASGNPGGLYTITNLVPNTYTITASNSAGLISKAVQQGVPDDYPNDLTSSIALNLAAPTGTMSVTALNGTTPIAGVGVTVTGGPSGVTLTGTTDATGVVTFPSIPAGSAAYTVTGTYGAATFQTPPSPAVKVATNQPTLVTLGVTAGTVNVSVKDSSSNPLAGATVTLTGPHGFSAVGTTTGTGTWSFQNVGDGSGYSVTATDGAATATATVPGAVTTAGPPQTVILSLATGVIAGRVTDGTNPLGSIPVTLTGPNSLVLITSTDPATGKYSFQNIGLGSGYSVTAAAGAATASATGITLITAGLTKTLSDLVLSVGSIQATVTEGGIALPNAKVTVTGPNAYSVTKTAGAGGVYLFSGIGAGSGYTVTATDGPGTAQSTTVSVSSASTTNVAIDIPAGSLKVTVDAGSSGQAGVTVALTGPNSYSNSGVTNASGVYTFASVPGGSTFTVTATIGGSGVAQTGVSVTSGAQTSVTLALPTGSIRASVLIGGSPLAGQTVTVTGPGSYSATGTTSSAGLAVFASVPIGTGYTVSTVYGSTVQQTGQAVTRGNHTDVLLTIPAGSLKVTVKNQSGAVLPGVDVALTSTNGVTAPDGTTAADGTYTFSLPAASGYKVTANYGASTVTSASQTVTTGATTSVTVTINTGSIKVTVQNSAGTTYSGAGLTLTGPNSFSATGSTTTGGIYTFSNIPAGTSAYSVAATYAAGSGNATGISVSSGGTTSTTVTIPTGSIKVTVTAGGSNVGGAAVTVTSPGGFSATGTTASGSGSVTLANIPAGTGYSISATDAAGTGTATGVNVTASSTTSTTIAVPVGSLAVTVTVAGSPVGGAAVTVTYPGGFSATGTTANSGPSLGKVTLANIPAGSGYSISATSNGATGTTASGSVTSGSTTTATVVIPTGSIAVTVKNQNGTSLNGASLTLTGPGSYSATGSTGSGNTYTFPNVPINPSGYTVTATLGGGTGSTSGVVVSAPTPAKPATVNITTGSIAVSVKDQNSAAVNGGNLTLTGPGSYSATGSPGSGNTYTFSNVPVVTGGYTVAAAVGAGSGSTPGIVVSSSGVAATVTVNTGTITVTVESTNCSQKLGGISVNVTGANGYSVTAGTPTTGSNKGIVSFSGVPVGSPYTATATSNGSKSNLTVNKGSTTSVIVSNGSC